MRLGAHFDSLARLLVTAGRVVTVWRLGDLLAERFYTVKDHTDCRIDSALLLDSALYGIKPDREHCRDRQQSATGDSCDNLARNDHRISSSPCMRHV